MKLSIAMPSFVLVTNSMKYGLLVIVMILTIVLIVLLFIKNQRDKKEFVEKLNKDYPHKDDKEGDIEIEDSKKI